MPAPNLSSLEGPGRCPGSDPLTDQINRWIRSDRDLGDEVFEQVYGELRRIASAHLRRERRDPLLQTTVLVHEAYLRLSDHDRLQWRDREHFFAFAARLMRRVLVDLARRKQRDRRGGGALLVTLPDSGTPAAAESGEDLVAVHEILARLEEFDPASAAIVELRFFGGLSIPEVVKVLGVSERTIHRRWRTARAWLYEQLHGAA